jgi:ketosteroid isomerase-like protein
MLNLRKEMIGSSLMLSCFFWLSALETTAASQNSAPPDEQAILRLEDEFAAAWEKRDLKFIEQYFSHDPNLIWFFERRQLKGIEGIRKMYERMFADTPNIKRSISNRVTRVYGNGAFSAANFRIESREAGKRIVNEGRISTFYARENDHWVVVHRHTSFQAPPGAQHRVPLRIDSGDPPAIKRSRR